MRKETTVKLLKEDTNLKQQLNQNQKQFLKHSQIAYYANLSNVQKLGIFTRIFIPSEANAVFKYDPTNFPQESQDQVLYLIIRIINQQLPKMKNMFCIAYLNKTIGDFIKFKKIMQMLPQSYFIRLKNIYIVEPGFLLKILQYFSFNSVGRLVDKLTVFTHSMQEIQDISQRISIQVEKNQEEIKKQQKNNNSKLKRKDSYVPPKFQPQTIKIVKNELYGKNIEQYEMVSPENPIPLLIWRVLKILIANPQLSKTQGIFRKSCDLQELQILQKNIIKGNFIALQNENNAYILTGIIKKTFNNLLNPLFPHKIYDQVLLYKPNQQSAQITFIKEIIQKMGKVNKHTFLILCSFFVKNIVINEAFNKMNPYNLSVVFGPCFFRPIQYKVEDLFNAGKFSKIIMSTLKNFQQIDSENDNIYSNLIDSLKIK